MTDADDFEEREQRTRAFLTDQVQRAIKLRSKDREFHGLNREFIHHKSQMLADFERSKDIKHIRDVGDAREQILRKFLSDSGCLPARYDISKRSARVASTTGHVTGEMDILLFDPLGSIRLMSRESVDVYPVESVYGAIQIKSRLNKNEIREGLENISKFKALDRAANTGGSEFAVGPRSDRSFGILFAYDTDLEWNNIIREIEDYSRTVPARQWTNLVFVLSKGLFLFGDDKGSKFDNEKIEAISKVIIHGYPDRDDSGLFSFYSILMTLLRQTSVYPANPDAYFRLPLVADAQSYEFVMGPFAEMGKCPKHGDYQRSISPESLKKVVDWCITAEPINWIKANHLAYGMPGDDEEAYKRQPGDVRIYNPDNHPLSDILAISADSSGIKSIAYDQIRAGRMFIFLPYYYSIKEGLISDCPKCPPIQFPIADDGD
jgi:hypothetical protein